MTRASPTKTELLDALGRALAASTSPAQALGLISAAGPTSARIARSLQDELARGSMSRALAHVGLLSADEFAAAEVAEAAGRIQAALAWVVTRDRARRERRRAIRGAISSPLALCGLMLVTEPIPAMILGAGSVWPAIWNTALLFGAAALAVFGIPWLFAHATIGAKLRTALARVPLVNSMLRSDGEAATAAVLATFSTPEDLGPSLEVARIVVAPPYDRAVSVTDASSLPRAPSFSESFALCLNVGVRAHDLPTRFADFHAQHTQQITTRLTSLARILAFAVAGVVMIHGVTKMLSGSLPGIGGDLGNAAEIKQLERELDTILH